MRPIDASISLAIAANNSRRVDRLDVSRFVGKLDEPDAISKAVPDGLPTIAFPYPTFDCTYDWQDLLDGAEPINRMHTPAAEDVMTILYTSGSTGKPKGVVISYHAYQYGCNAALAVLDIGPDDRVLSYLPLSHVTERMALVGPSIYAGAKIYFVESLRTFAHDLVTARPTGFGSVPRLWVKFQAGIHAKIPPARLRLLLATPLIGRAVARRIRDGMGFADCTLFASGSAPISPHTLEWYRKLGIDIGEGWGMTETSGLSCANIPFEARRLGTIGVPLEDDGLPEGARQLLGLAAKRRSEEVAALVVDGEAAVASDHEVVVAAGDVGAGQEPGRPQRLESEQPDRHEQHVDF